MATQTKPRRASSPSQGRFARGAAASRGQGLRGRRPPEPTGLKNMLGGILPGAAARKPAPGSKKGAAGGLALIAAAAGMAFKNRSKLSQLRHRHSGTPATEAAAPPASGDASPNSSP